MDTAIQIEYITAIENLINIPSAFIINDLIINNKRYKYKGYQMIDDVFHFYFDNGCVYTIGIINEELLAYYLDTPDLCERGYIDLKKEN